MSAWEFWGLGLSFSVLLFVGTYVLFMGAAWFAETPVMREKRKREKLLAKQARNREKFLKKYGREL